jgi:hypothetical protein
MASLTVVLDVVIRLLGLLVPKPKAKTNAD